MRTRVDPREGIHALGDECGDGRRAEPAEAFKRAECGRREGEGRGKLHEDPLAHNVLRAVEELVDGGNAGDDAVRVVPKAVTYQTMARNFS